MARLLKLLQDHIKIQEVTETLRTTSKELQASPVSVKVIVHGQNWHSWESSEEKNTADQKEQKTMSQMYQKHLGEPKGPKTFGKMFCGLMRQTFYRACVSEANTAFQKKIMVATVKHGGASVTVRGYFATSGPG